MSQQKKIEMDFQKDNISNTVTKMAKQGTMAMSKKELFDLCNINYVNLKKEREVMKTMGEANEERLKKMSELSFKIDKLEEDNLNVCGQLEEATAENEKLKEKLGLALLDCDRFEKEIEELKKKPTTVKKVVEKTYFEGTFNDWLKSGNKDHLVTADEFKKWARKQTEVKKIQLTGFDKSAVPRSYAKVERKSEDQCWARIKAGECASGERRCNAVWAKDMGFNGFCYCKLHLKQFNAGTLVNGDMRVVGKGSIEKNPKYEALLLKKGTMEGDLKIGDMDYKMWQRINANGYKSGDQVQNEVLAIEYKEPMKKVVVVEEEEEEESCLDCKKTFYFKGDAGYLARDKGYIQTCYGCDKGDCKEECGCMWWCEDCRKKYPDGIKVVEEEEDDQDAERESSEEESEEEEEEEEDLEAIN